MSRLIAALAATTMLGMPGPVAAQSMQGMDHSSMPGMTMPMPAKKKPVAKPAAKSKPVKARPAPARRPTDPTTKRRAAPPAGMKGMDHGTMPGMDHSTMTGMDHGAPQGAQQGMEAVPGRTPGSGQTAPQGSEQPMQGMDHPTMPGMTMPADQHSGHDMPGMAGMATAGAQQTGTALPAGNAPAPPFPTDHAADSVYGVEAMGMGRHHLQQFHGGQNFGQVLVNIAEIMPVKGADGYRWIGEAWYGGDINRLWLKSEGEGEFRRGGLESAELQALYSRTIGPYFNLQAGIRQDFRPVPNRTYAVVALQGLAVGWFELDNSLFLSNKGDLLARFEGYYDQRVTQRLILQPRYEFNFAAQDVPESRIGSGLSDAELGLRLRYEIRREFAPYVGVSWERQFGDTARYARADGNGASFTSIVAGIRVWF